MGLNIQGAYQGNKVDQYNLGVAYEQGIHGIEQNTSQSKYWYEKSAKQGFEPAQIALADVLYFDEKNYKEALYWYEKQATDSYSLYKCAVIYDEGLGIPKNLAKAKEYFIKSADYGDVNAQFIVAANYLEGYDGFPQSIELSYKYANMAYKAGEIQATYLLGTLHNMNMFADIDASFRYFKEGAEAGIVACQRELAWYYTRGNGTNRNWETGEYWYNKAAENGDTHSQNVINEMRENMNNRCPECGCPMIYFSPNYDYENRNQISANLIIECRSCDHFWYK